MAASSTADPPTTGQDQSGGQADPPPAEAQPSQAPDLSFILGETGISLHSSRRASNMRQGAYGAAPGAAGHARLHAGEAPATVLPHVCRSHHHQGPASAPASLLRTKCRQGLQLDEGIGENLQMLPHLLGT